MNNIGVTYNHSINYKVYTITLLSLKRKIKHGFEKTYDFDKLI